MNATVPCPDRPRCPAQTGSTVHILLINIRGHSVRHLVQTAPDDALHTPSLLYTFCQLISEVTVYATVYRPSQMPCTNRFQSTHSANLYQRSQCMPPCTDHFRCPAQTGSTVHILPIYIRGHSVRHRVQTVPDALLKPVPKYTFC